jgi:hypothetical protein
MAEQFFVEPDATNPLFLARVDGFDASRIIPTDIEWKTFPSLASLQWDSSGVEVTRTQAQAIASRWDATLP